MTLMAPLLGQMRCWNFDDSSRTQCRFAESTANGAIDSHWEFSTSGWQFTGGCVDSLEHGFPHLSMCCLSRRIDPAIASTWFGSYWALIHLAFVFPTIGTAPTWLLEW